jgi:hypothetical protein
MTANMLCDRDRLGAHLKYFCCVLCLPHAAASRTSWTNAGPDKDSDKRQRAAINAFAKAHGYVIVEEF